MLEITYDMAVAALEAAVEEKGADYVYPESEKVEDTCQYLNEDGSPSCIVGNALMRLGVTRLPRHGTGSPSAYTLLVATDYGPEPVALADERTARLFEWAQHVQDDGTPWGEAVRLAKEAIS
jgi:hypothetical protein